jgi:hypothetical protein
MSSMNPTEESHQTESLNDARDVEKVEAAPEAEGETLTASTVAPRPKPVVWGLVCVGLYTGAMLYGTLSASASYIAILTEIRTRHHDRSRRSRLSIRRSWASREATMGGDWVPAWWSGYDPAPWKTFRDF